MDGCLSSAEYNGSPLSLLFLFLNKAVEGLSLRIHPHTLMFSDLWEKACSSFCLVLALLFVSLTTLLAKKNPKT